MRNRVLSALVVLILLSIVRFSVASENASVFSGLTWLTSAQAPTGNWLEVDTSEYHSTATALDAVFAIEPSSPAYISAYQWMSSQIVSPTDYLSRRIITLKRAAADVSGELSSLLLYRNTDGGWGGETSYLSDNLDTALALQALKAANYTDYSVLFRAVDFLIANQNADGGWGFRPSTPAYPGDPSNAYVTAIVLRAISAYNTVFINQDSINRASAYLLTKQNTDGGFGSPSASSTSSQQAGSGQGSSPIYETALSFMALIESGSTGSPQAGQGDGTALQSAINYLTSSQLPNGSWNDDPYSTALALQALAKVKPNLSITKTDIILSNSMPTIGETITITANVRNTGLESASNVLVNFHDADPSTGSTGSPQASSGQAQAGGAAIASQVIPSIPAGGSAQASITYTIQTDGASYIYVALDPTNQIIELNETDNIASTRLWGATLPDLALSREDLTLPIALAYPNEPQQFLYRVRNIGQSAATNVTVELYNGNPTQGGTLLGSATIASIAAGQSATGNFTASFTDVGPVVIYLAVDRLNSVPEADETNNSADRSYQVLAVSNPVDVSIDAVDIQLNPARPLSGEAVQVSATVHNNSAGPAQQVSVHLYDGDPAAGGVLIGTQTIPAIGKMETATVAIPWLMPSGIRTVVAIADQGNTINEANETNNRAEKAVMADMIDIQVSSTDLTFFPPRPVNNDAVTLSVKLHNTGIIETGSFTMKLYNGDPENSGVLLQAYAVPSLVSDGTTTLTYAFIATPQTYRFYAVADTENMVTELYEGNNLAIRSLRIKSASELIGPDLIPVKVDLDRMTLNDSTLAVSGIAQLTFQNAGDAKIVTPFDLRLFEDRDGNGAYTEGVDVLLGAYHYTLPVWPGGADLVDIPVSGNLRFKASPVYVELDHANLLAEQLETNNILRTGADCEKKPTNPIDPEILWKWRSGLGIAYDGIGGPVAVGHLTDDNGDGRYDENDVPSIVFVSGSGMATDWYRFSYLRAVRGDTGAEIFAKHETDVWLDSRSTPAIGDLDGDGIPEIVVAKYGQFANAGFRCYSHTGQLKWDNSAFIQQHMSAAKFNYSYEFTTSNPVLVNLDGDDTLEINVGSFVFNSDGTVRWAWYWVMNYKVPMGSYSSFGYNSSVADLDLDGKSELVVGNWAYRADGTLFWRNTSITDGMTAIANLDDDRFPEIILVNLGSTGGRVYALEHDGTIKWGPWYLAEADTGVAGIGSFPVIADIDGDGEVEIGITGLDHYVVLSKDGVMKSSTAYPYTGGFMEAATVFDLDGDGKPETLHNAGDTFRIRSGATGTVLYSEMFGGGQNQNTFVADVNNDGHAEVLVIGTQASCENCGGRQSGLNVYKDKSNKWVGARSVWNQSSYHVTNVNDDGTVPKNESPSWLLNNTNRCQARVGQSPNPYLAPNLTASYLRGAQLDSNVLLTVRIGNGGATEAAPGATVAFYDGDPLLNVLIDTAVVTNTLMPGEYQDVTLNWNSGAVGAHQIHAVVNGDKAVTECRENDNQTNADVAVLFVQTYPDLSIGSGDITLPSGPVTEGSVLPVTVVVHNVGTEAATNVTVRMYEGSPSSGILISGPQTIPAIASGGSSTIDLPYDTLGRAGVSVLSIILDQENSVIESSETNNLGIVTVDVQQPTLPNLQISADSITITPASAQEGESVAITASVLNRGASTSSIPVRISVRSEAGGVSREVYTETKTIYPVLALGEAATVTANFGTTGLSGEQSIVVAIDPENTVAESSKDDNSAAKPLFIQSAGLSSSASLDKTAYEANENVTATIAIVNATTNTRSLVPVMTVRDSAGNLIAAITQAEPVTIGPNSTVSLPKTWNTGKTLSGEYFLTTEVTEEGRILARANAGFSIAADMRLDAKVTADKMAYNPKETVAITSVVASRSANYLFENLTARMTVKREAEGVSGEVCNETKTIQTLMPEATFTFKSYCPAATERAGTYTAKLEVLSGQTVLAASSAGFEVLSTTRTGTGLAGTIAATIDPVYQGREESFSISVTNNGTDDLPGLAVAVIVADPETGELKTEARSQESGVRRGETIEETQTVMTVNLAPKSYLAILQVQTAEMAQPKTLASALFEVKPGIEVTKKVQDVRNILVWLNDGCQKPEETDGHVKSDAACTLRRALIEQALDEAGVLYRVVQDKKDFAAELDNIFYTDYLILGDNHPIEDHVAEVLAARVAEGKGFLSSLFNRQSLNETVLGIKYTGTLHEEGHVVELSGNELGMQGSFPSSGQVSKIKALHAEEVIAWIAGTTESRDKVQGAREEEADDEEEAKTPHPAIIKRQYGAGKVLFLAFDLAMSSANIPGFPALLRSALDAVHTPVTAPYRPDQPVPVEIGVKSLGAAFDVRITETWPAELRVYDPASGQWITANPWVTDLRLEPNEERTLLFYALMPTQPGTYTLSSEVGYLDNGVYSPYQEVQLDLAAGNE